MHIIFNKLNPQKILVDPPDFFFLKIYFESRIDYYHIQHKYIFTLLQFSLYKKKNLNLCHQFTKKILNMGYMLILPVHYLTPYKNKLVQWIFIVCIIDRKLFKNKTIFFFIQKIIKKLSVKYLYQIDTFVDLKMRLDNTFGSIQVKVKKSI